MKVTPYSIISFLLLLAWSSVSFSAPLPITLNNAIDTFNDAIDTVALAKRGCVVSKEGKICTTVPTVAELVTNIKDFNKVPKLDSLFYSGLGAGSAISTAKAWHKANAEKANGRAGVAFDGIVNVKWFENQGIELAKQPNGVALTDQFQKRLSQAFAQVSNKKVYFFTAAGQDGTKFPATSTWGGWEFPALTRNTAVTEIIQVSVSGTTFTTKTIWKKGDRATTNPPLG
ncbi:hypothetical protein F5X68DRAFT_278653 [Plectosphaerella plurivora]|uniref:Uncharacterized protein n=1 Tax=Plectosphaerella plurivora TaxID=936078 RepID=A0A9P8V4S8_9PEZI|nr:hypothetical protein F5X68DRAFT_278653 [Plectosphaerella plurivora]